MERIILGWSPDGGEENFVVSPKRFSTLHGLSPCQSGIVSYVSRYQFERNPWLLDQSLLLMNLILEYGHVHWPVSIWVRKIMGLDSYLAPRARSCSLRKMSVQTYCMINGIGPDLLLPLKLVCDEPSRQGLMRAAEIIRLCK